MSAILPAVAAAGQQPFEAQGKKAREDWSGYMKSYNAARREELRRLGMCEDCGKEDAGPGHRVGPKCREVRRKREHAGRERKAQERRELRKKLLAVEVAS